MTPAIVELWRQVLKAAAFTVDADGSADDRSLETDALCDAALQGLKAEDLKALAEVQARLICHLGSELWRTTLLTHRTPEGMRLFERRRVPEVGDLVVETFMGIVSNASEKCFGKLMEIDRSQKVCTSGPRYLVEHLDGSSTWWENCELKTVVTHQEIAENKRYPIDRRPPRPPENL